MRFFNNRFPYTTMNDINLDWIIKKIKALMADVAGQDTEIAEAKTAAETAQVTADSALETAAGKQDAPATPGEVGQVLGLDAELQPVWVDQTGGGGGTNNYNSLNNKPSINSVTLSGNKTAADLGLATVSALNSVDNTALTALSQSASASSLADSAQKTARRRTTNNLLDNWYFAGGGSQLGFGVFPINQRGQTSYSNSDAYTIDRWKLISGTLTVASGGLTLSGTIAQILPASIGLPVFASALLSDGTMITPSYNDSTKTFTLTATGQTIVAVKLEIGSEQTLAHQEDSAWVLNEIPDYAEELVKCQAYFIRLAPDAWRYYGFAFAANETSATAVIALPQSMARNPTITLSGDIRALNAISTTTATGFLSQNTVSFTITSTGMSSFAFYGLRNGGDGGHIDISAEL